MEYSPKDRALLRERYLLKQAEQSGFDLKERRALMEGARSFRSLYPNEVAAFFRLLNGGSSNDDSLHRLEDKLEHLFRRLEEKDTSLSLEDERIILRAVEVIRDSFSRAYFVDVSIEHRHHLAILVNRFAKFVPYLETVGSVDVKREWIFEQEVEFFAGHFIDSFDASATAFQARQRQADLEDGAGNAFIHLGSSYRDCKELRRNRNRLASSSYKSRLATLNDVIEQVKNRESDTSVFHGLNSGNAWLLSRALHRALHILARDKERALEEYAKNPPGYADEMKHTPSRFEIGQGVTKSWSELAPAVNKAVQVLESKNKSPGKASAHDINAFLRRFILQGEVFNPQDVRLFNELNEREKVAQASFIEERQLAIKPKRRSLWERWLAYEDIQERCGLLSGTEYKRVAKQLFDESARQVRAGLVDGKGLYFLKAYIIALDAFTHEQDILRAPLFVPPLSMPRADSPMVYDFETKTMKLEQDSSFGKDKLHIFRGGEIFFRYAVEYARSLTKNRRWEVVLREDKKKND